MCVCVCVAGAGGGGVAGTAQTGRGPAPSVQRLSLPPPKEGDECSPSRADGSRPPVHYAEPGGVASVWLWVEAGSEGCSFAVHE